MEGTATGMQAFVSELESGLTSEALWGEVAPIAGLIVVIAMFAFGLYELRKVTKGASKGKVRF